MWRPNGERASVSQSRSASPSCRAGASLSRASRAWARRSSCRYRRRGCSGRTPRRQVSPHDALCRSRRCRRALDERVRRGRSVGGPGVCADPPAGHHAAGRRRRPRSRRSPRSRCRARRRRRGGGARSLRSGPGVPPLPGGPGGSSPSPSSSQGGGGASPAPADPAPPAPNGPPPSPSPSPPDSPASSSPSKPGDAGASQDANRTLDAVTRRRAADPGLGSAIAGAMTEPSTLGGALTLALGFGVGVRAAPYLPRYRRRQRELLDQWARASEREHIVAARLAQTDHHKGEFLALVSHELRPPRAAVKGFVDTVLLHGERLADDRRRELLTRASSNADELGRLVRQLMEFGRTESGPIEIAPDTLDVAAAVDVALCGI